MPNTIRTPKGKTLYLRPDGTGYSTAKSIREQLARKRAQ